MDKIRMTYDENDEMLERFDSMHTETKIWPTIEQIEDIMDADPEKYIPFAIFMYEKGDKPENEEQKDAKKDLYDFINRHLELMDEDDDLSEETE